MSDAPWTYSANCKVPLGCRLPPEIKRYAAAIAYDGSDFSGFQKQTHSPSVQRELEQALSRVANEKVTLVCAGRTDAGVHASRQVVHFDSRAIRSGHNWVKGANSQLPSTIRMLWTGEVKDQFHARFSALSRTYRYLIYCGEVRPALLHAGVTWITYAPDMEAMNAACRYLLGEQDFSAFRAAGCQSLSCYRNVSAAGFYRSNDLVIFEITANAFLLHMVRNIVGSMLEIGRGAQPPQWIQTLLMQRDRNLAAATAAAAGLYLVDVEYPDEFQIPAMKRGPFFLPDNLNGS